MIGREFRASYRTSSIATLAACASMAATGICLARARLIDAHLDAFAVSAIRVAMNGIWIGALFAFSRKERTHPHRRPDLPWVSWGVFGSLTVVSFFAAVLKSGMGLASLVQQATHGASIAVVAPLITNRGRSKETSRLPLFGALVGLCLLYTGSPQSSFTGIALAIASGIFAALAYFFVSSASVGHSVLSLMLSWTIFSGLTHLIWASVIKPHWPDQMSVWGLVIVAGALTAASQSWMTRAYRAAPLQFVTALSYAGPVLSLLFEVSVFGTRLDLKQIAGIILILGFGIFLPLTQTSRLRSRAIVRT